MRPFSFWFMASLFFCLFCLFLFGFSHTLFPVVDGVDGRKVVTICWFFCTSHSSFCGFLSGCV